MSDEERARNRRFRFEVDRRADCTTRALCRTVLSRYADVAPGDWQFVKGAHGKPEIAAPSPALPLRFNLSHTRDYVVCAVALDCDLGVDIECVQRSNDVLSIADHYFSPRETRDLFALPPSQQENRFFDYWTLKEAYMKASGEGVSLGLDNFSFELGAGDIALHLSPAINDDPTRWRFWRCDPYPAHRLALAFKAGAGTPVELRLLETVPLTDREIERDVSYLSAGGSAA